MRESLVLRDGTTSALIIILYIEIHILAMLEGEALGKALGKSRPKSRKAC